jgi:hypothetical protein
MTNSVHPLPKWIMIKYSKLWRKFNKLPFTSDDFKDFDCGHKGHAMILAKLRQYGWLKSIIDKNDARKRTYSLLSPDEAIPKIREKMEVE